MSEAPKRHEPVAWKLATQAVAPLAQGVDKLGRLLGSTVGLAGLTRGRSPLAVPERPGDTPGIESVGEASQPPRAGQIRIRCFDYGSEQGVEREVPDLQAFLKEERPGWSQVRWINVGGLEPSTVNGLREHFGFHTLAAEDVVRVPQRPKVEAYDHCLFLVVRVLRMVEGRLRDEQVSLFLFKDVVLTFQETAGDLWDPIRQRLQKAGHSRLRVNGASYLVYAMLDSVVDHYFPILESYGDLLEEIEKEIFESSSVRVQQKVHLVKRELALLRRVAWPMREVITELQRDETAGISPTVKTYLRDVYDHTVQIMDIVETHREMAAGLNDLYMSAVSNRMNEVMKVLTIMASFFIPLTFVAGIYGMNFDYIPELKWRFGYVGFWGVCAAIAVGMGVFFQRRGWLGRRQ